jgi:hypothetical protein
MENTIEENILSPKVGRLTSQKRTWSSVVLLAGVRIALMLITIKKFIVTKRSNEQKLILNLI